MSGAPYVGLCLGRLFVTFKFGSTSPQLTSHTYPPSNKKLSTTASTTTQTMQAAVHHMPHILNQYPRQALNHPVTNGTHIPVPPTPPVATRKRKRPHQYTVSYSEVQEVDRDGKLREVIVIDDTPPPPTASPTTTMNGYSASYQPPQYSAPIRTRARAAAEAQALSASTSSAAAVPPPPKKRRRDPADDLRGTVTKKTISGIQQQPVTTTKSWASGSAAATDDVRIFVFGYHSLADAHVWTNQSSKAPIPCDDKEGHYIIVPDDLIARRCMYTIALVSIRKFTAIIRSYCSPVGSRNVWESGRGSRYYKQYKSSHQDHSGYSKIPRCKQDRGAGATKT